MTTEPPVFGQFRFVDFGQIGRSVNQIRQSGLEVTLLPKKCILKHFHHGDDSKLNKKSRILGSSERLLSVRTAYEICFSKNGQLGQIRREEFLTLQIQDQGLRWKLPKSSDKHMKSYR